MLWWESVPFCIIKDNDLTLLGVFSTPMGGPWIGQSLHRGSGAYTTCAVGGRMQCTQIVTNFPYWQCAGAKHHMQAMQSLHDACTTLQHGFFVGTA
jgi:hypothetical protein